MRKLSELDKRWATKEKKVRKIIERLEAITDDEKEVVVKRHKNLVIVVSAWHQSGIESVLVLTESRVARWFDDAAEAMRLEGCGWEDAVADAWPVDDDDPANAGAEVA